MSWMDGAGARLRQKLARRAAEARMEEEMRFHLEMEIEKNRARGITPEEARRLAMISFGGVEKHKERMRDGRRIPLLEELYRDAGYALRSFRRSPGFTAAVVVTLGLGIGGTTAVFGIIDALYFRAPQGVARPDEVVALSVVRDDGTIRTAPTGGPGSYMDYLAIRDRTRVFSGVAAYTGTQYLDLGRGEEASQVLGTAVTANFFRVLGVRPAIGRFFTAEEDAADGAHPVVVIGDLFWKRAFAGAPDVLGRTLLLNGRTVTVIGVAAEGFTGIGTAPTDIWVPGSYAAPLGMMSENWRTYQFMAGVWYVGRLAPGVAPESASGAVSAVLPRATADDRRLDPTPTAIVSSLIPARGPAPSSSVRLSLWVGLVSALVLVIACANIANLLLARAAARGREIAVRVSLGAGRARLVRQLLTESTLLALGGGALGVLIAYSSGGLVGLFPLPPSAGHLNVRMLLFSVAASLLSALLFGLVPALRAVRTDPSVGLKAGRAGPAAGRLHRGLVVVQVALSLLLLVGAGLFVRSLRAVYSIDPGMDTERLTVVSVDLVKAGFSDADREAFLDAARERLAALPGVERTARLHFIPFGGISMSSAFSTLDGEDIPFEEGPSLNWVGPGYFATAGVALLGGREFGSGDGSVAVVNEAMARLLAPGAGVVGRCLRQAADDACARVVGVVANTRRSYLDEERPPMVFYPAGPGSDAPDWSPPSLLVRTRPDARDATAEIRAAVQGLRPDLPFVTVQRLEERFADEVLPYRLGAILFSLFGLLALALASLGVYGVLSYFVVERTREIGVRRSLGASVGSVLRLMIRRGMGPVLVGIALGLGAALLGTRLLESLLFGVAPRDPVTFLAVPMLLAIIALLATLVPARRAARVDPMVALRHE